MRVALTFLFAATILSAGEVRGQDKPATVNESDRRLPVVNAKTPEDAFSAYIKAAADQDLKMQLALCTPKQIELSAASWIQGTVFGAGDLSDEEFKRVRKQIMILVEHGLTLEDLKKPNLADLPSGEQQKAQVKFAKSLVTKVKDQTGLILKLDELEKQKRKDDVQTKQSEKERREAFLSAKLAGLKIEGDEAGGTVILLVRGSEGKETKHEFPMRFKKKSTGWQIELGE